MNIRRILAANLRRHRRAAGLSQEGLAFECGLHRTYISGVERGARNPTVVVLAKIADALNIGPAALLKHDEVSAPDGDGRRS